MVYLERARALLFVTGDVVLMVPRNGFCVGKVLLQYIETRGEQSSQCSWELLTGKNGCW